MKSRSQARLASAENCKYSRKIVVRGQRSEVGIVALNDSQSTASRVSRIATLISNQNIEYDLRVLISDL